MHSIKTSTRKWQITLGSCYVYIIIIKRNMAEAENIKQEVVIIVSDCGGGGGGGRCGDDYDNSSMYKFPCRYRWVHSTVISQIMMKWSETLNFKVNQSITPHLVSSELGRQLEEERLPFTLDALKVVEDDLVASGIHHKAFRDGAAQSAIGQRE